MFAAARGNINVMKILIDAGIDLDLCDDDGISPLMMAAAQVCDH